MVDYRSAFCEFIDKYAFDEIADALEGDCSRNKEDLENSNPVGCFNCSRVFDPGDIRDWAADGITAICPFCGMGTVVGDSSGTYVTSEDFLKAFSYASSLLPAWRIGDRMRESHLVHAMRRHSSRSLEEICEITPRLHYPERDGRSPIDPDEVDFRNAFEQAMENNWIASLNRIMLDEGPRCEMSENLKEAVGTVDRKLDDLSRLKKETPRVRLSVSHWPHASGSPDAREAEGDTGRTADFSWSGYTWIGDAMSFDCADPREPRFSVRVLRGKVAETVLGDTQEYREFDWRRNNPMPPSADVGQEAWSFSVSPDEPDVLGSLDERLRPYLERSHGAANRTIRDRSIVIDYKNAFEDLMLDCGMLDEILDRYLDASTHNREELEKSQICGCFSCGTVMSPQDIDVDDWTDDDDTAICPECRVDALVPDTSGLPITPEFLDAFLACRQKEADREYGWGRYQSDPYACIVHLPFRSAWITPDSDFDSWPLDVARIIFNGRLDYGEHVFRDDEDDSCHALVLASHPDRSGTLRFGLEGDELQDVPEAGCVPYRVEAPLCDAMESWVFMLSTHPIDPADCLRGFIPQDDGTFLSKESLAERREHFGRV